MSSDFDKFDSAMSRILKAEPKAVKAAMEAEKQKRKEQRKGKRSGNDRTSKKKH
jgi:hypothetical protein